MQSAFYDGKSRMHENRGECTELGATCVYLYPCPYWDRDNLHGTVNIFLSETRGIFMINLIQTEFSKLKRQKTIL